MNDQNFADLILARIDRHIVDSCDEMERGGRSELNCFEYQFIGKSLSNESGYKAIEVNKPGSPLNEYQVDGISGGTFTSVGVEEMMDRTLSVYQKYIKNSNRS